MSSVSCVCSASSLPFGQHSNASVTYSLRKKRRSRISHTLPLCDALLYSDTYLKDSGQLSDDNDAFASFADTVGGCAGVDTGFTACFACSDFLVINIIFGLAVGVTAVA